MSKTEPSTASGLGPDAKIELRQRRPDAHHPFLVKRMSWSWFSASLFVFSQRNWNPSEGRCELI